MPVFHLGPQIIFIWVLLGLVFFGNNFSCEEFCIVRFGYWSSVCLYSSPEAQKAVDDGVALLKALDDGLW